MALLKYFRKVSNDNIALASASSGLKEAAENEEESTVTSRCPTTEGKEENE